MKTILIVNDSSIQNALLGAVLRAGGYAVTCAKTVAEARRVCEQGEVELALVELLMYQDNGFEVAPLLNQVYKVPVVLLLSRRLEADLMWSATLGLQHFLYRPFSANALLACVEEHQQKGQEVSCANLN